MTEKDRRSAARHDSLNFIRIVVVDEGGAVSFEGMGRTLNISERGVSLETFSPLADGQGVVLTIGLDDEMVEIAGRVVHARPGPAGSCHSGIEFAEMTPAAAAVLRHYLEAFRAARSGDPSIS
jgi:hypothetical protein